MANPIISKLMSQQGINPNLKNMVSMMKGAKNPEAMIQQLASQNPQMKQVLDMVGNGDPKQIFMNACKQKGIDPNQILSMMK